PALPQAKTVTLSGDKVPLGKALAEVSRQTGIRIENPLGGEPELRLDLKDKPFWQALDTIAAAANARVYLAPRNGQISLVKRSGGTAPPASYSGPFRVSLKRISVAHDFDSNSDQTTATLEVCWEPALQPFLLETRPQDLVIEDDANKK